MVVVASCVPNFFAANERPSTKSMAMSPPITWSPWKPVVR